MAEPAREVQLVVVYGRGAVEFMSEGFRGGFDVVGTACEVESLQEASARLTWGEQERSYLVLAEDDICLLLFADAPNELRQSLLREIQPHHLC